MQHIHQYSQDKRQQRDKESNQEQNSQSREFFPEYPIRERWNSHTLLDGNLFMQEWERVYDEIEKQKQNLENMDALLASLQDFAAWNTSMSHFGIEAHQKDGWKMKIGTISMLASTQIPSQAILCDGRAVSTSTYPDLYRIIGNIYGGDSSQFRVPDLVSGRRFIRSIVDPNDGLGYKESMTMQTVTGSFPGHLAAGGLKGESPGIFHHVQFDDGDSAANLDDSRLWKGTVHFRFSRGFPSGTQAGSEISPDAISLVPVIWAKVPDILQ